MTRQVSEIAEKQDGIKFRITSLNPLRPANAASDEERMALEEFETGVKEKGVIKRSENGDSFFYMAPLITEAPCLKCHAMQGYKEGEIRGGISVTLPFIPDVPFFIIIASHLFALGAGLSGIIFSGIKLAHAYSVIKRQAVFDALTGIPNRYSFSERLLSEFNRSLRDRYHLSVIMGDIDHFKLYNDTYGHAAGDECLISVAKAIEKTLKRPGDFCARYGGEEFIIILPATDRKGAARIADDIRENIKALDIPHENSPDNKVVTISLGVGTKDHGASITHDELLKMADDALYIAKTKGRNRVEIYYPL
jgi:diguanylate cyclase (GGDEF)-like protein